MRTPWRNLGLAAVVSLATGVPASAQDKGIGDVPGVEWVEGPAVGRLGTQATRQVPAGWRFSGPQGAARLMELMENPVSHREQGIVFPAEDKGTWFAVFEFNPIGYVEDEDKDELDPDAILSSIREGNEASNEERRRRGWTTMEIVGWDTPPHYDAVTNNLEWAVRGKGEEGGFVVNHNVRLLGREGVMEVTLVGSPEEIPVALPDFRGLLATHEFVIGRKYAEYRSGDRIAQYGLVGLVTGGALAVAAKTGILQKFWKLFVLGLVAIGAAVKKLFTRKPGSAVRRPHA